jgi:hypothetical protein
MRLKRDLGSPHWAHYVHRNRRGARADYPRRLGMEEFLPELPNEVYCCRKADNMPSLKTVKNAKIKEPERLEKTYRQEAKFVTGIYTRRRSAWDF